MGRRALTSHMEGEKHKKNLKASLESSSMGCFVSRKSAAVVSSSAAVSSTSPTTTAASQPENTESPKVSQPRGMKSFMLNDAVTKAEILYAIESVMNHSSLSAAARNVLLFPTMFPDSVIASKMQLQRNKIGYLLAYGVSPYFEKELVNTVSKCDFLVVRFDESLNKVAQKQQMDVNVRFWDEVESQVVTRYLTSIFLGRTRAVDLFNAFLDKINNMVKLENLLQISMDGPNVNIKFLNDFNEQLTSDPGDRKLLDMGSCGLHTLHNAFKTAMVETGWDVVGFLRALHNLFKDSPARRSIFTRITGLTSFPKKFCAVRWVQNADVAQRAIDLLPSLKSFVTEIEKDKSISSKSYDTVVHNINDAFLGPKLEFFKGLANDVEPFFRRYQSDEPLAPFLYSDLTSLLKIQLERFLKPEVLESVDKITGLKLTDKDCVLIEKVDIGIATKNALSKANKSFGKIKDSEVHKFREGCKKALLKFSKKMLEKSPLCYKLTRLVSCLDPNIVAHNPKIAKVRMESLLTLLLNNNWISSSAVDNAMREFRSLCEEPCVVSAVKGYDRKIRLEPFWINLIGDQRPNLFKVIKLVCTLSHGNANVERGFSVNSECIVENMRDELLVARRCVFDKITSIGGISNLKIDKSLILAARDS